MKFIHLSLFASLPCLAVPAVTCAQSPQPSSACRPNLVFIMADQFRGDALGCMQKEPVQTPHLDRLASEGILFTNAVSNYPVSSPARAMWMTGMYPASNRVTGNCNSENSPYGVELPSDAVCWSDVLKQAGYATGYIGKWHLDAPYPPYVNTYNNQGKVAWNEWCPPERRHGFETWIAYGTYDNHLHPMYWNTAAPRDSFYYVDQWGPEYEAGQAIEFIRTHSRTPDTPFALVVSMNPPHTGYELVPDNYKQLYAPLDVEKVAASMPYIPSGGTDNGDYFRRHIADYYACITGVDEQVGRIVQALKDCDLYENTIVVFTSDHGVCMGGHEIEGKNTFYEEAMHIPMIVSWKGQLYPRKSQLPVALGDLYPTLLSMMGMGSRIPGSVQTYNWSGYLSEDRVPEKEVPQPYYYCVPSDPSSGKRGVRTSRYTYVVEVEKGIRKQEWLFDRLADPAQMHNLAKEEPVRCDSLQTVLKDLLTQTNDSFIKYLIP